MSAASASVNHTPSAVYLNIAFLSIRKLLVLLDILPAFRCTCWPTQIHWDHCFSENITTWLFEKSWGDCRQEVSRKAKCLHCTKTKTSDACFGNHLHLHQTRFTVSLFPNAQSPTDFLSSHPQRSQQDWVCYLPSYQARIVKGAQSFRMQCIFLNLRAVQWAISYPTITLFQVQVVSSRPMFF